MTSWAFILTFFIWHNLRVSGNTIVFMVILIANFNILKYVINNMNKREGIITSIVSVLFAVAEVIGNSINMDYSLNNVLNKWFILNILGYFSIGMIISKILFNIFEYFQSVKEKKINIIQKLNPKIKNIISNTYFKFAICTFLIFLAWIPYFLKYYPRNCNIRFI